jgi:endonuclease YncB( thermonuclease family)
MSRGSCAARRWRLVGIAFLFGVVASAEDERVKPPLLPPTVPAIDFAEAPAYPVVDVRAGNIIVVQLPGERRTVRLLGTYVSNAGKLDDAARPFLARLLTGESVYLKYEADWPLRDRHDRFWAYAYRAPDGLPVNLELIRQGYARLSAQAPFEHQQLYRQYERFARSTKKGVWAPRPEQPVTTRPAQQPVTAAPPTADEPAAATEIYVYKTPSGRKYHRAGCSYLGDNAQKMTLAEAKAAGLEPCSRCDPPE